MRKRTQEIRLAELIKEIKDHPHRDELIAIMNEQVSDDTYRLGM